MDRKCKGFRYSSQHGFGYLCHDLVRKQGYDDWEYCGFWSGEKNCQPLFTTMKNHSIRYCFILLSLYILLFKRETAFVLALRINGVKVPHANSTVVILMIRWIAFGVMLKRQDVEMQHLSSLQKINMLMKDAMGPVKKLALNTTVK